MEIESTGSPDIESESSEATTPKPEEEGSAEPEGKKPFLASAEPVLFYSVILRNAKF